jgi:hypothetical protein
VREKDTPYWVRAEMHSIITNLYSALDSLAQQINCIYSMGFSPSEVKVYHPNSHSSPSCFRCQIPTTASISAYLDNELDENNWFGMFNRLRNLMVHKNLPVLQLILGTRTMSIIMPDDPLNTDPQQSQNRDDYSKYLEVNQYCDDRMKDVIRIIERAYTLLETLTKTRYGI